MLHWKSYDFCKDVTERNSSECDCKSRCHQNWKRIRNGLRRGNNFNRMYLYRIWRHEREIESEFQSLSWYVTEYHLDGFQYIAV